MLRPLAWREGAGRGADRATSPPPLVHLLILSCKDLVPGPQLQAKAQNLLPVAQNSVTQDPFRATGNDGGGEGGHGRRVGPDPTWPVSLQGRHEDAGTQRDDCMRHGRGLGRDRPADTLISDFPPPGRGHAALCAASSGRPEPTTPAGVRSLRILTCRIRGREEAAGPRPPGLCPGLPHGRHPALTSKRCTSEGVPRVSPVATLDGAPPAPPATEEGSREPGGPDSGSWGNFS